MGTPLDSAVSGPRPGRRRRFAISAAVLAVVGSATVLAYIHFFVRRPVGSGPAGPPVDRAAFVRAWTERPVLLLGLGDSVTAGFGARQGNSYFDRLAFNSPDDAADVQGACLSRVLPRLTTRNLAVSGTTSLQHEAKHLPQLESQPLEAFGVVVMTTGGNDLIHNYGRSAPKEGAMYGATLAQARPWVAAFEARLGRILDRIAEAFPGGCAIFLANIYDPTDSIGDIETAGLPPWPDGLAILAAYNEVIARTAGSRPNVYLVDIHSTFLGHGLHCTQFWQPHYRSNDPHYWYYYNLEDPNDRGYDAIRRLFLSEIESTRSALAGSN